MLRENLIFRVSLIISTAVHIGGFGLLGSNSHFSRNGLTSFKDSVVVYEIGWRKIPAIQKKINPVRGFASNGVNVEDSIKNRDKGLKDLQDKEYTSSQAGSSGYARENAGNATDEYLLMVRKRIESAKFYPIEAKRRLITGSVAVSFYINENGMPENVSIIKSSGFSILDNTAEEIILKASPFPKPPKNSYNHFIQTTIIFDL